MYVIIPILITLAYFQGQKLSLKVVFSTFKHESPEHLLLLLWVRFFSFNPFPAKEFVPLVETALKNSLSEKFCLPAEFEKLTPVWCA